MKKITLIISTVLIPFVLLAQNHSIEINSDAGIFNSAFSVETILNSLDYIDDAQKIELLNSMSEENTIYLDVNNEIKYSSPKGMSIAFGNHLKMYGEFGDDIFRLALYGNTSMLGEEIDLLPLEGCLYHYSDITFGYAFTDKITASLSLIAGHQFVSGEFSRLTISSGEYGESFGYDVSVEGVEVGDWEDYIDNSSNLFFNDGKLGDVFNTNGRGVSLGFDYKDEKFGGNYQLSVRDLGFINWDEESTNQFEIINSDELEPIQIDNIDNIDTDSYFSELDTLSELFQPYLKSYKFTLPTQLSGYFNKGVAANFIDSYTVSFEHRIGLYSVPRLSLDIHRAIKQHEFILGYHLGGLEKRGLQFKYHFNSKNIQFSLYTKNANSIDISTSNGYHLGIGLGYHF
jgi:hypothetical protein